MNRPENEAAANQATSVDNAAKKLPDPECHPAQTMDEVREKTLDKTIADSFPTSDPPSSIPNPSVDDSEAA